MIDLAKPSNVAVQTQLDEAIAVEKQAKATEAMEKARSQQRASAQKAAAANAQLQNSVNMRRGVIRILSIELFV